MAGYFNWWPYQTEGFHQVNELQTENAFLRIQLQEMTENVETIQNDMTSLLKQKHALCEEHENALSSHRAQLEAKDDAIRQLQSEVSHHEECFSHIKAKDDKIADLQGEIFQYKKSISGSTRLDGQLSDTSIQSIMDGLFYAVRDWALDVARQEETVLDSIDGRTAQFLCLQVPGGKEGSTSLKVNALVAILSGVLVRVLNKGWVFGVTTENRQSPALASDFLHASIKKTPNLAFAKKKQWTLLTNEILFKDNEANKQTQNKYAEMVARFVQRDLGADCPNASTITQKLRSAIEPHMHIVQALYHQEADYSMVLPPATAKGKAAYLLQPKYMYEVNGEDEGRLQASIFPILYKEVVHKGDTKATRTVVCKAKLMVES